MARIEDRDLTLVLTGRADNRLRRLLARARALGIEQRVRHLGYVEAAQVPALYRRATALVFPSLFEGFGSPPLEAMACGCPVASSTAASLPEVCGDAALLFDPEDTEALVDAIDRITGDEPLRRSLTERGVEQARAYTWSSAAERHVRVYESVV